MSLIPFEVSNLIIPSAFQGYICFSLFRVNFRTGLGVGVVFEVFSFDFPLVCNVLWKTIWNNFLSFNSHVGTGLHIICSSGFQSIEGNGVVFVSFDCYGFRIF